MENYKKLIAGTCCFFLLGSVSTVQAFGGRLVIGHRGGASFGREMGGREMSGGASFGRVMGGREMSGGNESTAVDNGEGAANTSFERQEFGRLGRHEMGRRPSFGRGSSNGELAARPSFEQGKLEEPAEGNATSGQEQVDVENQGNDSFNSLNRNFARRFGHCPPMAPRSREMTQRGVDEVPKDLGEVPNVLDQTPVVSKVPAGSDQTPVDSEVPMSDLGDPASAREFGSVRSPQPFVGRGRRPFHSRRHDFRANDQQGEVRAPMSREEFIARFDTDDDGTLSEAELQSAHETLRAERPELPDNPKLSELPESPEVSEIPEEPVQSEANEPTQGVGEENTDSENNA